MPNLYLIHASGEYLGYDTYDSAVVCACSEEEARYIHPNGDSVFVNGKYTVEENEYVHPAACDWIPPNKVQVALIGVAAEHIRPGTVICASYNAG